MCKCAAERREREEAERREYERMSYMTMLRLSLIHISKDISRKVSTALKAQMESGEFKKRNLPYGYRWDEELSLIHIL